MEFYTIDVYNSNEQEFFDKLTRNVIDTFCDIRQRRGVRGSKYSFVNSNKLQHRLGELDIKYAHIADLAPTTAIRDLQKQADSEKRELKSQRQTLGDIFISEYKTQILDQFNFEEFLGNLERIGVSRVVLFCVEENAEACHRSIVASKLMESYRYEIVNL